MADQQNSDASRNVQTQNGKPRSSGKRLEILRHPLVLLIIGATITSLLFPYLNSRVNRNELLQEAKLKKASEIRGHVIEFNSELNALETMLELFHNMNVRLQLKPAEFRQAQLRFVDDFSKRYLDFDEKAWWWYSGLEGELSSLRQTSSGELQTLDNEFVEYGENVGKSKEVLKPLWVALTSADYSPNDLESRKKVDEIIAKVQKELPPLHQARNILAERMAGHFTLAR